MGPTLFHLIGMIHHAPGYCSAPDTVSYTSVGTGVTSSIERGSLSSINYTKTRLIMMRSNPDFVEFVLL